MADNTKIDAGTSGDTIATDDIGGVKFQRVKIVQGADGVNDGDLAASNPMPVELKQEGFIQRVAFNILKRLSIDATGRLRVAAESAVISSGTVTAVTNITNWGLSTPTAKSQWESTLQFQSGFRRNLVHS